MKKFVKKLIRGFIRVLRLNEPTLFNMWISEQIDRVVKVDNMLFDANSITSYYRGINAKSGEEKTIKWISEYIQENDCFYDIGANAGTFTILSAVERKANVISFEPESQNYAILNRNIFLNKVSDKVKAYNIALNDETKFSILNISNFKMSGSGHNFDTSKNFSHSEFTPVFKQGAFGMSLDSFVYDFEQPFPNHIKIDVDGNEYKIIKGMDKCLNDKRLKTLAVEINSHLETDRTMINAIKSKGFRYIWEQEEGSSGNYFFIREDTLNES